MDCCENCYHWNKGVQVVGSGECRRKPPQVIAFPVRAPNGLQLLMQVAFPITDGKIYCGEHTPKVTEE